MMKLPVFTIPWSFSEIRTHVPCMRRRAFRALKGMTIALGIAFVISDVRAQETPPKPAEGGRSSSGPPTEEKPPPSFSAAHELWIEGHYERALEAYETLRRRATADAETIRAGAGEARVLMSTGRYQEARERLESLPDARENSASWHVLMAELLRVTGDYDRVMVHCRKAIELDPADPAARRLLGEMLEYLGRREEAIETWRWFDRQIVERRELPKNAEWLTHVGVGFYRYSLLTQTDLARRTRHVLTELFQAAYERVDRSYWPARLAAADLLRSRYNNDGTDGSLADYAAALRINSRLAEAHVGIGEVALDAWSFEEVERRVRLAREINSALPSAAHLLARCRLTERRYQDAIAESETALRLNPNDLMALSILAAAHACRLDDDALRGTIERIEALNSRCSMLYRTLGDALSGLRDYAGSEKYYLKAIEYEPSDPNPRTELGMMYMQWGLEDKARAALDAAWALDSFNQRTFNTLELLDSLHKFARHETAHFIIRHDETADPGLGEYLGAYLERIYPEVCGDYGVTLHDKTIIEVFPTQAEFAVRITGKPWIWTVGACTGRVIALTSPRADVKTSGPYDIASVLRHEFTHTVTLAATDNRIPHWLTEGLAVHQEASPRGFDWCQLLADAVRRDRLFTLDSITWGFVRPRRPTDRQLAYAQSEWMCEYIIERFGYDIIRKMLAAFKAGRTQDAVFRELLGIEPAVFDMDFAAWARKQAQGWCFDLSPPPDLTVLRAAAVAAPTDGATLGRLARAELEEGQPESALRTARKALEIDESQPDALEVAGCILSETAMQISSDDRRQKAEEEARSFLLRLVQSQPANWRAHKWLGTIALNRRQFDEARKHFEALQRLCSLDPTSYTGLAAVFLHENKDDLALGQLLQVAEGRQSSADVPAQIARIFRRKQQFAEAVHWYRRAIFVHPFSVELHSELAELHQLCDQPEDALREYEMLTRLAPRNADFWTRAALTAKKLGKDEKAVDYARKAVALDASSAASVLIH